MTNGGVDYSFDCTGDVGVIKSALECCIEVSAKLRSAFGIFGVVKIVLIFSIYFDFIL